MSKSAILKEKAKSFFNKIGSVDCPAFPKEKVFFNSKGLQHLFYKGPRSKRNIKRIEKSIELLPRAVKLLELMPIPQEEDMYNANKKKYRFWAFEGVLTIDELKLS